MWEVAHADAIVGMVPGRPSSASPDDHLAIGDRRLSQSSNFSQFLGYVKARVAWTRKRDEVGSLAGFFLLLCCDCLLPPDDLRNSTPSQGAFFSRAPEVLLPVSATKR